MLSIPMARARGGFALGAALLLAAFASPLPPPADYEGLAKGFRDAHGLEKLGTDDTALVPALDQAFLGLDLGIFDVRFLRSALTEPGNAGDFRDIALGLIDLQTHLLGWLSEQDPGKKNEVVPPELATVRAWVATWKPDLMKKAVTAKSDSADFAERCGADAKVKAALEKSAEGMRTGSMAGLSLAIQPTRLALLPSRADFVGFAAFVGSLHPEWKKILWTSVLNVRNEFHINDLLALPMTSPAADGGPKGLPMNEREATGLLEHVTQYAGDRLCHEYFGSAFDGGLLSGIAIDLVIELYGENNSRVYGSGEGHSTPARNKFVRGGRSSGGKFAKINADPKWRNEKGKDYFTVELARAQKDGLEMAGSEGKAAPSPHAHFSIDQKDAPGTHDYVSGPFIGEGVASSKEVPENFIADYQEFLRAYRAGFVHWLLTAKAKGDEARPLAKLLRSCIKEENDPLAERVVKCFGIPLTSPTPDTDALEWQYLDWIARQK